MNLLKLHTIFFNAVLIICVGTPHFYNLKQGAAHCNHQDSTSGIKKYSEGQLNWADFEGKATNTGIDRDVVARSTNGVNSDLQSFEGEGVCFNVYSYFYKSTSWVVISDTNQYVLNHEQRHFDITELGARILRSRLAKMSTSRSKAVNVLFEINVLKPDIELNFIGVVQDLYDKETEHGSNSTLQGLWDKKIQRGLDSLNTYSEEKIIIKYTD